MNCLCKKIKGLWSLVVGLFITGKYFCSPTLTTFYPRQTVAPEAEASFRGPIELVGLSKDPSTPKCISCMLCVQACPSGCIAIKRSPAPVMTPEEQKAFDEATARGENPKKPSAPKNPGEWHYDFTLCSLCACCVEACPVDSITFSHELYLSGTRREDFHMDLLARLKRTAAKEAAKNAAESKGQPAIPAVQAAPGTESPAQAQPAGTESPAQKEAQA